MKSIVRETKIISYEVILIDNASNDDTLEIIKQEKLPIRNFVLIENKENLGFAKGNNQGIEKAKGKYILLLNSDTVILNGALQKMTKWMDEHPEAGVATCRLLNCDKTLQPTGGFFPDIKRAFVWLFFLDDLPGFQKEKSYHPKVDFYDGTKEMDWITGAFILARREVLVEVKGFDPKFFMYVEEMEMCYRIKQKGYKIFYAPTAEIIHIGGASTKKAEKGGALIREFQGLIYLYQKHCSRQKVFLLRLMLRLGALGRMLLFGIIKRQRENFLIYAKAFKMAGRKSA